MSNPKVDPGKPLCSEWIQTGGPGDKLGLGRDDEHVVFRVYRISLGGKDSSLRNHRRNPRVGERDRNHVDVGRERPVVAPVEKENNRDSDCNKTAKMMSVVLYTVFRILSTKKGRDDSERHWTFQGSGP